MTTSTLERTEGLATLNKAIASIKDTIEEAGGIFNIHKQVRVGLQACTQYSDTQYCYDILIKLKKKVRSACFSQDFHVATRRKTPLYNFDSDDTTLNTN